MTLGPVGQYDLNKYPVGADRAFDQRSPVHSISWGYRREAYGSFTDAGCAAGLTTWAKAGIPANCYLFARPAKVDDPHRQAANFLKNIRVLGRTHSAVIDYETDSGPGFNNGLISIADTQTIIDALDAAGVLVVVYSNEWQYPRGLKRVAAHIVANYSQEPHVPHDAWQFTSDHRIPGDPASLPEDYDVWTNLSTFRDIYPGLGPVVVPIPLPPTPNKERFPMTNETPKTLHRVVDLPVGTVFHEFPSVDAAKQGIVTHADVPLAAGQKAGTMAFGYEGDPMGVAGWIGVANGDRGVWVRGTDVAEVRVADKSIGV
jgi:hypothetical protein